MRLPNKVIALLALLVLPPSASVAEESLIDLVSYKTDQEIVQVEITDCRLAAERVVIKSMGDPVPLSPQGRSIVEYSYTSFNMQNVDLAITKANQYSGSGFVIYIALKRDTVLYQYSPTAQGPLRHDGLIQNVPRPLRPGDDPIQYSRILATQKSPVTRNRDGNIAMIATPYEVDRPLIVAALYEEIERCQ